MTDIDVQTPAPTGPRVQRREAWVDLPDAYAGFRARIWVNAPGRILNDLLTNGDDEEAIKEKRAQKAASQVVLEHNGWLDFDGNPYPPASDPEFWDAIPLELTTTLLFVIRLEMNKLPNSLIPKKRR